MSRGVDFGSRDVEEQIVEQKRRVHMNQVKAPTWRKVKIWGTNCPEVESARHEGPVYTMDHEVGPWKVGFFHGPIS